VKLLLDTHVWIWSQECTEKLGPSTHRDLTEMSTRIYVSPISTLEMARLVAGGKIGLTGPLAGWIADTVEVLRCTTIEISHRIAAAAYDLPGDFHNDPSDRLLVATARVQSLTLLTADERILAYPHVESRDARR